MNLTRWMMFLLIVIVAVNRRVAKYDWRVLELLIKVAWNGARNDRHCRSDGVAHAELSLDEMPRHELFA